MTKPLNDKTGYVRRKWGLTDGTIEDFKVGYCHACPTSPHSNSITIPYYDGGELVNIRHRLGSPNGHRKYQTGDVRPDRAKGKMEMAKPKTKVLVEVCDIPDTRWR